MSLLTLCLAGLLVCAWKFPEWVKEVGILALALGILGQIIGLYSAFEGIEQAGGVSQEMLAVVPRPTTTGYRRQDRKDTDYQNRIEESHLRPPLHFECGLRPRFARGPW